MSYGPIEKPTFSFPNVGFQGDSGGPANLLLFAAAALVVR